MFKCITRFRWQVKTDLPPDRFFPTENSTRMWDELRYRLGTAIRWRLRRQVRRTLAQTRDCQTGQLATLRRLLRLNQESDFSREFGLARVRTTADFQQALPITSYEFFEPHIERMLRGESGALLGRANRLIMFALTSGTTAATKYIPVTRRFYQDYRRGWQLWGIQAFDDHPHLHRTHILQIASDFDKFRTPAGTPCGNISGLAQQNQSMVVRQMYAVPQAVLKIADPFAKQYAALRFAVADGNIGLMMSANPSTLLQLAGFLADKAECLLRDIFDGTLTVDCELPREVVDRLQRGLRADPKRSRILQRLVAQVGSLTPAVVWPRLQLLGVWTGGSVATYLPRLREMYGDVAIRDHGLSASEGRMTIPYEDESSSGLLDVDAHYFEFIPQAEMDSAHPIVLEAHELEVGGTYFILLTTASGLYRYNIHDVVECTGFLGSTPLLRFLHKGAHISSLTGEKLSESQIVTAMSQVSNGCISTASEYVVSPVWGEPPGYVLWLEEPDATSLSLPSVAREIEQAWQQLNTEYADKRLTGRLAPLQIRLVPQGTWACLSRTRQAQPGASNEQYKHPFLIPRLEFEGELAQLVATLSHT